MAKGLRVKKAKRVKEPDEAARADAPPPDPLSNWRTFFCRQRHPLLRSNVTATLMAGRVMEVERLPKAALLDALLLAFTARTYFDAEVVDDFPALLRRADEVWREPGWSCRVFDQAHCAVADFIIRGSAEFVCREDLYIPAMVGRILAEDPPAYFADDEDAA